MDDHRVTALYVRVSTEAQAEEGYSIPAQLERLEAYCQAMGWKRTERYIDGGYSGSNLDRPEMRRLIDDAQAGRLCAVVVYKLDRLSRSQKDTLHLIEDVFLPNQVDFVSLNENIDTSNPYGRAMIGILSAFAQLERENIFLRTRMGMQERVKQGYWMGGGGTPFGYDYDPQKGILVPNEHAATVRRIFELYVQGWGPQRIAAQLGLKSEKQVTQILSRRCYLGIVTYKGEEYPGLHAPIVSQELFDLVQLKRRSRSAGVRATGGTHLLTGLIYCGRCGARMRYIRWGRAGYKLRCYSRDASKPYLVRDAACDAPAVWADEIEEAVRADLFRLSVDGADALDWSADPLDEIAQQIAATEGKLKRLYHLYAVAEDESLLATIQEQQHRLELLRDDRRSAEERRLAQLRQNETRQQLRTLAERWPLLDDSERQTVVRDCVEKIVIDGERVELHYTFTLDG